MKLTVKEILNALDLDQEIENDDVVVNNAIFDSRKVEQGSLFVPLKGDRDGHEFIQSAINGGATASLWQKDHEMPENVDIPLIVVDDVLQALQDLSKYYLNKVNPKVVAVTGSNGKTTTKDMIAAILGKRFNVTATYANFNNEIGVPVTILNMDTNTEFLVVELGMDRPGQIDALSAIVQPDVAVITMVGEAHIEFFKTRDKIADAKMEIVNNLRDDGIFVYNGDDDLLIKKAENVLQDKLTFGFKETNDVFTTKYNSGKTNSMFSTNLYPNMEFELPLMGDYNISNALAAISVAYVFQINELYIKEAISDFIPTKNRTEWKKSFNDADILSDVYNSNPTAVKDVLINLKDIKSEGKKIVVLGDMLELGEQARELHESIFDYLNADDFEKVYLIGPQMKFLADKLLAKYNSEDIMWFNENELDALAAAVKEDINPEDIVLLKASNGLHLNKVLSKLEKN